MSRPTTHQNIFLCMYDITMSPTVLTLPKSCKILRSVTGIFCDAIFQKHVVDAIYILLQRYHPLVLAWLCLASKILLGAHARVHGGGQ